MQPPVFVMTYSKPSTTVPRVQDDEKVGYIGHGLAYPLPVIVRMTSVHDDAQQDGRR